MEKTTAYYLIQFWTLLLKLIINNNIERVKNSKKRSKSETVNNSDTDISKEEEKILEKGNL